MMNVTRPNTMPAPSCLHLRSMVDHPPATRFQAWFNGFVIVLLPGKGPVESVVPFVPMYSHSPPHINLMLSAKQTMIRAVQNQQWFVWCKRCKTNNDSRGARGASVKK